MTKSRRIIDAFLIIIILSSLLSSAAYADETQQPESVETISYELSQGQVNIVKRARQLHEIEWTPLEDRYQWGYNGVFYAENTYTGIPYGQPIYTGYVGYKVTVSGFLEAVNDNTSEFYTGYSHYNKIAPFYSCDCSGFVSYAWGLNMRKTTYSLPAVAVRVDDQSINAIEVGDCLDKLTSHVVLVSDVTRDAQGNVTGVEIMEQTPVITRLTLYGENGSESLDRFKSYYLEGGYIILRNPDRDSVTYIHDCAVPIDGDYCPNCKEKAPKTKTDSQIGSKTVTLYHEDTSAVIYYTTDNTTPTKNSSRYTEPITFFDTSTLKAIALTGSFSGSNVLEYTVKVPKIDPPTAEVMEGSSEGMLVSSGSKIKLATGTKDAVLYYTTDGATPTENSNKYTGEIVITRDTIIKVFACSAGMKSSDVAVFSFKIGKVFTITALSDIGGIISPSGVVNAMQTSSKSFTITPMEGCAISHLLVDGVSFAAQSSYDFTDISGDHTIRAVFKDNTSLPFSDVGGNAWYRISVSYSYRNGLFKGTSDTEFSPESSMTRAMFVTVLGRLAGVSSELTNGIGIINGNGVRIRQEANTESKVLTVLAKNTAVQVLSNNSEWYEVSLGDVTGFIRNDLISVYAGEAVDLLPGTYYSAFVEWAYLTGIINGVGSSTFNSDGEIIREHMCMLLYNYAVQYGLDLPITNAKVAFSDDASISPGAKAAVYALWQAGVINGMGDGAFNPQGTATRAQVAQIFVKFINAAV